MQRSCRQFLATTAAASVLAPTALAADPKRQFTIDLRPGSIGVKANQVEAIRLAAKHGFESVAASPRELAKLSDAENESLMGSLDASGLVWGSSGLPDFRWISARTNSPTETG